MKADIGIIGALENEVESIIGELKNKKTETVSGITFEFGYAQCHRLTRRMNSDLNYNVNTGSSTYYLPFGSLAEYHAAVALTYEPATLTQVNETTTEV